MVLIIYTNNKNSYLMYKYFQFDIDDDNNNNNNTNNKILLLIGILQILVIISK